MTDQITVRTKHGKPFRRAGLAFGKEGLVLKTADLTDEQLEAIEAEPMLIVEKQKASKPKAATKKATRASKGKTAKADKPADADASNTDKADD